MSAPRAQLEFAYAGRLGSFALDVRFAAPLRGITALFGPSGCGKTSVLRCIAGLSPLRGRLVVGGEVWEDAAELRPAHARPVGYVFQEASLFPHLRVRDNLRYGLRRALRRGAPQRIEFEPVVALLGLTPLLQRSPADLSGGERQRVAVGRALLSQPRLLLMDEPLSALDRATVEEILPYLEALPRALDIPILYVTHDAGEVERLADHMVLLEAGRVVASGPLADVLVDPQLPPARGASAATLLEGQVTGFDARDALSTLDVGGTALLVPGRVGAVGATARLHIAADDVSLAVEPPGRTTILNVIPARIREITALDAARANVLLALGGDAGGEPAGAPRLLARITRRSLAALQLAPGQRVHALVKAVSIVDPRHAQPDPAADPPGAPE